MSFNVVISSEDRIAGSSVTNAEYYFDWNNFRDDNASYEMSFVFQTQNDYYNPAGSTMPNKILQLSLPDLPQLNYRTSSSIGANTSGVVGFIYPIIFAPADNEQYYCAKGGDNPSVFVKSLPSNSVFKVDLVTPASVTTPDIPDSYMLILSFKKI